MVTAIIYLCGVCLFNIFSFNCLFHVCDWQDGCPQILYFFPLTWYSLPFFVPFLPGLTDGVLRWSRWTVGEGLALPAFDIGPYSSQVNDRC